ncbi:MAG: GNAT family N-acetyltransferase [Anaerostipes hadrus]|nr:GNAT family N-acetyltransferase [Anaerostipes hadrus]
MNKADFFLTDGLLIQNDKYILKVLNEEDKENYLKLYRENSIVTSASSKMSDVDYDEFAEFVWEKIPEEDSLYVSVFLKADYTYLGNIFMQHMSLTTPEIGIDVLEEYHRQDIAYETIPLFAKRVQELMPVDYFVVRIYSDNEPSKKLFEKLGAELMGKEPSEFAEALSQLKEKFKEEYEGFIIRNPDVEKIADERCILQFKYFPG